MISKNFKAINKIILTEYGFSFFNKKFYLLLNNIIIRIQYRPYPFEKGQMIAYDILIKELVKGYKLDSLHEIEKAFDDITEIPAQMPALKNIIVQVREKKQNVFYPTELEMDSWAKEFKAVINHLFNPFKEHDLVEMKSLVLSKQADEKIIVNNRIKEYLLNRR
ncbi:MAG: hypothetical protein J6Y68_00410 [Clostridia bacterium]|nr:hypothetical protein [Clostridia bacterium]